MDRMVGGSAGRGGTVSDGDRDLAAGVPRPTWSIAWARLAQRVGAVHDRRDLAGLDQLLEGDQVRVVRRHEEGPERLAAEPEQHDRADRRGRRWRTSGCSKSPPFGMSVPVGRQRAAQVGQRVVRDVVEDEVVPLAAAVKSSVV